VRRRDNNFKALERELRAERAEPSDALKRRIVALTATRSPVGMRPRMRVLAAGVLTTALLVTVAMLGATSYAGNGNGKALGSGASAATAQHDNAADSQYDEKVIICHRAGRAEVTLRLSREGAKAHLREHAGDTAGPCV
jgi:hypothetical protein